MECMEVRHRLSGQRRDDIPYADVRGVGRPIRVDFGDQDAAFGLEIVRECELWRHGDRDDTVPLSKVIAWAEQHKLPVTLVPGSDHFFHRKLAMIKSVVKGLWH